MNDNQDKDRMTHASLFSGIGGAEIAATWMGWTNIFHCEINPFGRKVLEYWYPNSTSYEDITKTDFSEWRGRVDVLTAGFPCQPFSVAGQRKGADDDRYLWPQVVRAVHEIRPAWVVGENVAGILTMVQPGEEVEVGSGSALFDENHLYRTEHSSTSSKPSAKTSSVKDIPSSRLLFRLVPSERPTAGTGCGLSQEELLPTSQTQGLKINVDGKTELMPLYLLPTLTASCHNAGTTANRKDGTSRESELNHLIARQVGQTSQLNPLFVEEMMGFPSDWLVSPFQSGGQKPSKP